MLWNYFIIFLLIWNVVQVIESLALTDNDIDADLNGFIKEMQTEFGKNRQEMDRIWELQKNLSLTIAELEKHNFDAIGERISELILKSLSLQKEEMRQSIENALTLMAKSLPTNEVEFDSHLNCVKNCGSSENLPYDCAEAIEGNNSQSGIYLLNLNERRLRTFGVFCEYHAGEGWTIIQRRQSGLVNFFKNWIEYKSGFGDLNDDYWLGLERIHVVTSKKKYKLWIEMETYTGNVLQAYYSQFSIGSEGEGYKLNVGGYSGNAGENLSYNNGYKFSTFDNDNNGDCANERLSAWWYKSCTLSHLNGQYKNVRSKTSIYWDSDIIIPLKYVHMAIHPV